MVSAVTRANRHESDLDLWTDGALASPYEAWRELRNMAPVVWLRMHDLWALPRYGETRSAVDDWETFSSAHGVSINPAMNELMRGTTISTDPPRHNELRRILRRPLRADAVLSLKPEIQSEANKLVARSSRAAASTPLPTSLNTSL